MSSKAEKAAIKIMIEKHRQFYDAPLGQRKCKHNVSIDCLNVAAEKLFEGHMCKECIKKRQNDFYKVRMVKRGEAGNPVRNRSGRPCKIKEQERDEE